MTAVGLLYVTFIIMKYILFLTFWEFLPVKEIEFCHEKFIYLIFKIKI